MRKLTRISAALLSGLASLFFALNVGGLSFQSRSLPMLCGLGVSLAVLFADRSRLLLAVGRVGLLLSVLLVVWPDHLLPYLFVISGILIPDHVLRGPNKLTSPDPTIDAE